MKKGRKVNTPELIKERIVIDDNLCWIWQGGKDRDG